MTTASICTIGDEILIGQILDTNSCLISKELGTIGVRVSRMISIGDSLEEIIGSLTTELSTNDIVITTGGLGPTKDDITKEAILKISGSKGFYVHEGQLEIIHDILHSRGLDVLECNKAQALVPDACEVILNKIGTAPIIVTRLSVDGKTKTMYSMPGVPFETKAAIGAVIEDIKKHNELSPIYHRNLMTYGLAESALSEKIADWEDLLPENLHLAYLPNPLTGVRLRLSSYGGTEEQIDAEFEKLRGKLGALMYSDQDDTIEQALGRILKGNGLTISTAESCTGGKISSLIASVSGASTYYLGSVISYAISVKENVLSVPGEIIEEYGVVSPEVASAMAEGVRRLTGSDYSVSTTGYAGAEGDKLNPGGTVWVGVATPKATFTKRFQYKNDRKRNIQRFAASALHLLLMTIKSELNDRLL